MTLRVGRGPDTVPSRRLSTRRTVADPGTGERIERSETDLI